MTKKLGYTDSLYVLAFDHRGSFRKIAGIDELTEESISKIKYLKKVIFSGFEKAVTSGLPMGSSAVLVDEQYGADIAREAKRKGFSLMMPVEKSGQEVFDFEFGSDFAGHIEEFDLDFVKVLVRYNPANIEDNKVQRDRLRVLSDWCLENRRRLLIEMLIEPVGDQKDLDKMDFDRNLRPDLTIQSIKELQEAGVEADVWKLEGYFSEDDYKKVLQIIRSSEERKDVSLVVLGRGEGDEVVKEWIRKGKGVTGVIGFAVGRTIFAQAVADLSSGRINEKEAVDIISAKYLEYYQEFAD